MTTAEEHTAQAVAAIAAMDKCFEDLDEAGAFRLTKEEERVRRIRSYSNGLPRKGRGMFTYSK